MDSPGRGSMGDTDDISVEIEEVQEPVGEHRKPSSQHRESGANISSAEAPYTMQWSREHVVDSQTPPAHLNMTKNKDPVPDSKSAGVPGPGGLPKGVKDWPSLQQPQQLQQLKNLREDLKEDPPAPDPPGKKVKLTVKLLVWGEKAEDANGYLVITLVTLAVGSFGPWMVGSIFWLCIAVSLLEILLKLLRNWADAFKNVKCAEVSSQLDAFDGLKWSLRLRIVTVVLEGVLYAVVWWRVWHVGKSDGRWQDTKLEDRWNLRLYELLSVVCLLLALHWSLAVWVLNWSVRLWAVSNIAPRLLIPGCSQKACQCVLDPFCVVLWAPCICALLAALFMNCWTACLGSWLETTNDCLEWSRNDEREMYHKFDPAVMYLKFDPAMTYQKGDPALVALTWYVHYRRHPLLRGFAAKNADDCKLPENWSLSFEQLLDRLSNIHNESNKVTVSAQAWVLREIRKKIKLDEPEKLLGAIRARTDLLDAVSYMAGHWAEEVKDPARQILTEVLQKITEEMNISPDHSLQLLLEAMRGMAGTSEKKFQDADRQIWAWVLRAAMRGIAINLRSDIGDVVEKVRDPAMPALVSVLWAIAEDFKPGVDLKHLGVDVDDGVRLVGLLVGLAEVSRGAFAKEMREYATKNLPILVVPVMESVRLLKFEDAKAVKRIENRTIKVVAAMARHLHQAAWDLQLQNEDLKTALNYAEQSVELVHKIESQGIYDEYLDYIASIATDTLAVILRKLGRFDKALPLQKEAKKRAWLFRKDEIDEHLQPLEEEMRRRAGNTLHGDESGKVLAHTDNPSASTSAAPEHEAAITSEETGEREAMPSGPPTPGWFHKPKLEEKDA